MKLVKRHPLLALANSYLIDSPAPSNLSYLWNFGSLLGTCLALQIITGVTLAMHYIGSVDLAFSSVEHIMRDVNSGWLIRYLHSNGAGFFFIFVYIHMAKALYYGSYRAPRVLLWSIGVVIFLVMIITAFLGTTETCLKWLNMDEILLNYDASGLEMSPKLKFWLDRLAIKPVAVYEDLQKDEVKERIRSETRKKAGIYGIFNLVTGDFYIGSAISNRFYYRFYRHLIKGLGSKPVSNSVNKHGLENFVFVILEYFPVEVTKKNNPDLMALETSWIKKYFPPYNILLEAGNSFGYKHTEDTKQRMKDNYSKERREQIGSFNKEQIFRT